MSSVVAGFEIGMLIGVVLFVVCYRKGLIQRWSRRKQASMPIAAPLRHNAG